MAAKARYVHLCDRIRHVRTMAQLSRAAFARRMHVTTSAVAQWENLDQALPSSVNLIKIAERMNVAFD
jgi:DNA-binding transcriptional regulator YiaG